MSISNSDVSCMKYSFASPLSNRSTVGYNNDFNCKWPYFLCTQQYPNYRKLESRVPEGWTANVYEVGFGGPWEEQKWEGPLIAREYGLENPRFVIHTTQETGELCIMFR